MFVLFPVENRGIGEFETSQEVAGVVIEAAVITKTYT